MVLGANHQKLSVFYKYIHWLVILPLSAFRDSDADIIDPIKAAAKAAEDDEDPVKSLPAAPPKQKKAKKKKGKQNRYLLFRILQPSRILC